MVAGAVYFVQQIPEEDDRDIALATVQRGDLEVKTHFRGELQAVRSLTLTAPNLGSQSQILQLACSVPNTLDEAHFLTGNKN